jgi:hypothetical protein
MVNAVSMKEPFKRVHSPWVAYGSRVRAYWAPKRG